MGRINIIKILILLNENNAHDLSPLILTGAKCILETDIKTFRSIAQSGVSVQASLIRERLVTIKGAIVYDDFTEK